MLLCQWLRPPQRISRVRPAKTNRHTLVVWFTDLTYPATPCERWHTLSKHLSALQPGELGCSDVSSVEMQRLRLRMFRNTGRALMKVCNPTPLLFTHPFLLFSIHPPSLKHKHSNHLVCTPSLFPPPLFFSVTLVVGVSTQQQQINLYGEQNYLRAVNLNLLLRFHSGCFKSY